MLDHNLIQKNPPPSPSQQRQIKIIENKLHYLLDKTYRAGLLLIISKVLKNKGENMNFTNKIKVSGLTDETAIALAIMDANCSDVSRPSKSVLDAASAATEKVTVIENNWISLRGKKGVTIYHSTFPAELV